MRPTIHYPDPHLHAISLSITPGDGKPSSTISLPWILSRWWIRSGIRRKEHDWWQIISIFFALSPAPERAWRCLSSHQTSKHGKRSWNTLLPWPATIFHCARSSCCPSMLHKLSWRDELRGSLSEQKPTWMSSRLASELDLSRSFAPVPPAYLWKIHLNQQHSEARLRSLQSRASSTQFSSFILILMIGIWYVLSTKRSTKASQTLSKLEWDWWSLREKWRDGIFDDRSRKNIVYQAGGEEKLCRMMKTEEREKMK